MHSKITLIFALFLTSPLAAQTFVQGGAVSGSQQVYTFTYTQPNSAPCFLFLSAWFNSANLVTDGLESITDTQGNVWIPARTYPGMPVWYVPSCKAGKNTVTIAFRAPKTFKGFFAEYTGTFTVDVEPPDENWSRERSSLATSPSITTTSADLVIGYGVDYSSAYGFIQINGINGFTVRGGPDFFIEDLVQDSPGTIFSAVRYDGAPNWRQGVAAFKPIHAPAPLVSPAIQHRSCFGACQLPISVHEGALLIAALNQWQSGVVSDSLGNTWKHIGSLWYVLGSKPGLDTVNVSAHAAVAEYPPAEKLDAYVPNDYKNILEDTAFVGPVVTTSENDLLLAWTSTAGVLAADASTGGQGPSYLDIFPGDGYLFLENVDGRMGFADAVSGIPGLYATEMRYSDYAAWRMDLAAFKMKPRCKL